MSPFSSNRERRLWIWLVVVMVAIYSTLGQAPALGAALRERGELTGALFVSLLVLLVVVSIFFVRSRPGWAEIAVWIGILGVYVMAWIRIGVTSAEERTHLFEYSLVAALVHEALIERQRNGRRVPVPALLALLISILLGWIDEGIQALLPNRYYDNIDVLFNTLAATIIIGARWLLERVRLWALAQRASD